MRAVARRKRNATQRQWCLFQRLCHARGYTVQELAAYFGVSEKTIRRDLELLQEAGIELEEQLGEYGRKTYRTKFSKLAEGVTFAWDQALAIALAPQFMLAFAGTPLYQGIRKASEKVLSLLSEKGREYVKRTAAALYWTRTGMPLPTDQWKQALGIILDALEDRRVLQLTYRSERQREARTYLVHPYGLVVHRHSLYLVGYSEQHGQVRHFKLNRVEEAKLTENAADVPDDFDIEDHLAGAFAVFNASGEPKLVRIRFSPTVARYVTESQWHPTQRVDWTPNGGVILELELRDTTELKSWVLSFGAHAEVLEPVELRQEIAEELKAALSYYAPRQDRKRKARLEDRQLAAAARADRSTAPADGQLRQLPRVADDEAALPEESEIGWR